MVIGYLCGANTGDEANGQGVSLAHELARRIRQRFSKEYGSVLCRDVREAADGDCPDVVGKAAKWTAEVLLEECADTE